jgi:hypothetical protein
VVTITTTTITRDEVWRAFRRTPDGRLRERDHGILRLRAGRSCPEVAQWLYRDEDTGRGGDMPSTMRASQAWSASRSRGDPRDSPLHNGRRAKRRSAAAPGSWAIT